MSFLHAVERDPSTVAHRVEGEHHLESRTVLAQAPDGAERFDERAGHGSEQAAPRQHDAHFPGDTAKLGRKGLHAGPDVEDVVEASAKRAARVLPDPGGAGIDSDEQPLGRLTRALERKAAISRSQVDDDHNAHEAVAWFGVGSAALSGKSCVPDRTAQGSS